MKKSSDLLFYIIGAAVAGGCLLLDLSWELGVAGGVPYVTLIVLGVLAKSRRFIIVAALAGSVLTAVGYFYSPTGAELWKVLINRFLALFVIWITAGVSLFLHLQEKKIQLSKSILDAISHSQSQFIIHKKPKLIFDDLLGNILRLTQSEFGFIGEILHRPDGKPYLKTNTLTNVSWSEETRALYNKYGESGMEWEGMDTLFGAVITTGKAVIANDPAKDHRSGGLPSGHPPLGCFLGLPFYHGDTMTGMVGLANRPGGYDAELVEFLQPFLTTCAHLLLASKNNAHRQLAEEALKESQKKTKGVNDQMRLILQGTSSYSGEEFLRSLVRQLAKALKVRHAQIGEWAGEEKDKVRILAFWSDGEFVDNWEYELSGTPCERVLGGKVFYFEKDVQRIFSEDEYLVAKGIQSYMGIPLFDNLGYSMGILNVFDDRPMVESSNGQMILSTFAARAEMEIQRQEAEEQINRSLEEKELLLKEIHHRTKNNMQIISSLLWLQSKDIKDEQSRELFRDCSNRILSMALVHEKMYASPDFSGIDLKEYLVSLVDELRASYGLRPGQIKLVIDSDNLSLDLKSGIPCGLLIQELVCNSMKHAFPSGQKGEIRISIRPVNENKVEMKVSDSGVGFPEGFDIRSSKSLGLQLVTMLVEKQLGGTLELNGNGRTEFKLVFEKGKL